MPSEAELILGDAGLPFCHRLILSSNTFSKVFPMSLRRQIGLTLGRPADGVFSLGIKTKFALFHSKGNSPLIKHKLNRWLIQCKNSLVDRLHMAIFKPSGPGALDHDDVAFLIASLISIGLVAHMLSQTKSDQSAIGSGSLFDRNRDFKSSVKVSGSKTSVSPTEVVSTF